LAYKATELPNSPLSECSSNNSSAQEVFVALGDSITHARVSADYLKILRDSDWGNRFAWINAGINSRLAYNLVAQIDKVIECQPVAVSLLIGTNDVLATRSNEATEYYSRLWQLPRTPDFAFYQDNLLRIIKRLKSETKARIAIMSIPPIGEILDSPMNIKVSKYNQWIKSVANQLKIEYLPLNERMTKFLQSSSTPTINACSGDDKLMEKAIVKRYLLGKNWNDISHDNQLQLLTDCVHLNERGANIIAGLIQEFLRTEN